MKNPKSREKLDPVEHFFREAGWPSLSANAHEVRERS